MLEEFNRYAVLIGEFGRIFRRPEREPLNQIAADDDRVRGRDRGVFALVAVDVRPE